MLAPMEKITDSSFRYICHKYGADLTFTEQIRFETLIKKTKSALMRIKLYDDTPTMIQIMGKDEEKLDIFLKEFTPEKGFQGFNLNLGCPSQSYVKQGIGSAMIKRPTKVKRMVDLIKNYGYDVNVKLRLGVNKTEKREKVYLKLIEKDDADFFIVHARYRSESYERKADWSVFPECVNTGKAIVANGDIQTKIDVEKMKEIGCIGVMIGRAAMNNPLIFGQLKEFKVPQLETVKKEYIELCKSQNIICSEEVLKLLK
ncbi:MAG: putative tRNA-dihydrouridine synthase [Candidatus Heimdallarchaeota archaeon AB_125]|nr:MAG: putative tRNA-dihydrouridine synthase [Candidatus Heimdallarchaeota archaeon AB_125]